MQERYETTLNSYDRATASSIALYFGVIPSGKRWKLYTVLDMLGLCQADVVLALLRLGRRSDAEALVGRPITRCPPCLQTGARPILRDEASRAGDDRKVVWVVSNPRQPNTSAWHRWLVVKVGRTVGQMIGRGLTRRDLRLAVDYEWVKLDGEAQ